MGKFKGMCIIYYSNKNLELVLGNYFTLSLQYRFFITLSPLHHKVAVRGPNITYISKARKGTL